MLARKLVDAGTDVFRLNFRMALTNRTLGPWLGSVRLRLARAARSPFFRTSVDRRFRTGRLEGGTPLSLNDGDRFTHRNG